MALSTSDVAIVRKSWAVAAQNAPLVGELFYSKLFQIAPETRPLFRQDMRAQRQKLTATLGFIVEHLDDHDPLSDAARQLALRHVNYGVKAEHYASVGAALIWALQNLLGSRFGSAEATAWTNAYTTLTAVMIAAAYPGGTADGPSSPPAPSPYTKV